MVKVAKKAAPAKKAVATPKKAVAAKTPAKKAAPAKKPAATAAVKVPAKKPATPAKKAAPKLTVDTMKLVKGSKVFVKAVPRPAKTDKKTLKTVAKKVAAAPTKKPAPAKKAVPAKKTPAKKSK